jgi:hypothetical protein
MMVECNLDRCRVTSRQMSENSGSIDILFSTWNYKHLYTQNFPRNTMAFIIILTLFCPGRICCMAQPQPQDHLQPYSAPSQQIRLDLAIVPIQQDPGN